MPINRTTNRRKKQQDGKQRQRDAVKWFISTLRGVQRDQAEQFNLDPNLVLKNRRTVTNYLPGQIYFWRYDPKWKDTLPYYDTAPLVIILDIYEDGFLGLNTHYLRYDLRIKLIELLMATITAKKWDHKTQMRINYGILKSFSKYDFAKPALKRYLFSHMRSKIVRIQPENYVNVAYLPIERFVKASKQTVWNHSERMGKRR